jgi:hypothetical protein
MLEVNPGRCRDVDELRITGKRPARPQATAWACPSGPKPPPKYTYKPVRHSGSTMPIYSCNSFLRIGLNLFRLDLQFLVQPVELLFRLFQLLVDLDFPLRILDAAQLVIERGHVVVRNGVGRL